MIALTCLVFGMLLVIGELTLHSSPLITGYEWWGEKKFGCFIFLFGFLLVVTGAAMIQRDLDQETILIESAEEQP